MCGVLYMVLLVSSFMDHGRVPGIQFIELYYQCIKLDQISLMAQYCIKLMPLLMCILLTEYSFAS